MVLKNEILELEIDLGITKRQSCSRIEDIEFADMLRNGEALPEDIIKDSNGGTGYFRVIKSDISESELDKLLKYRQTQYLRTIRNCIIFFTVIDVLGIVFAMFGGFGMIFG